MVEPFEMNMLLYVGLLKVRIQHLILPETNVQAHFVVTIIKMLAGQNLAHPVHLHGGANVSV